MNELNYRKDKSQIICVTHTFCRNLQSRGSSSFWSLVSIMCVRLSSDSLSLQLHTAELLTSEPCCSEVRKLKSSPWIVLMMKLEDTRESFLMVPFASCRSWSRSWTQNIGKGSYKTNRQIRLKKKNVIYKMKKTKHVNIDFKELPLTLLS